MEVSLDGKYKKKKSSFRFAQIPSELIKNPKVSKAGRLLFGIYHSYSPQKDLKKNPNKIFVSQRSLAKDLGCQVRYIKDLQKELEREGWISVKRRKTNFITLHSKPKKK